VFLSRGDGTVPVAMRANVEHNHALHEHTIILTVSTEPVPHIPAGERVRVHDLGYRDDHISQVRARFGYLDHPALPGVLLGAEILGLEAGPIDIRNASYFISKLEMFPTDAPGMAMWRKRLFVATSHLASDPIEAFGLPRESAVIMSAELRV
jgi:KUP system potassium uptake protein